MTRLIETPVLYTVASTIVSFQSLFGNSSNTIASHRITTDGYGITYQRFDEYKGEEDTTVANCILYFMHENECNKKNTKDRSMFIRSFVRSFVLC